LTNSSIIVLLTAIAVNFTPTPMLKKLFGSRLRTKLLGWLLSHSDESFFVRQMEQLIEENSTNVSRELRRLGQMGIVQCEKRANLKYYKIKQRCPFYQELKGLFLKTVGAPGEIKEVLKDIEGIETAFIYGSFAKGEEDSGSDIDLFLVGGIDEDELLESLPSLESKLGREINYSIYGLEEFRKKRKEGNAFINTVLKKSKLVLWGNPDELCEKLDREGFKTKRTVLQWLRSKVSQTK
jgi:predicted nucleotidyltransferase